MYIMIKMLAELLYPFWKKDKILIMETHFPSGSNTYAVKKEFEKCNIIFDEIKYPSRSNRSSLEYKIVLALFHINVSRYKIILNTNGYRKFRSKQILIDFWHGVPIKSMLHMELNDKHSSISTAHNMDYLVTSSKLESTLLASCMFVPFNRHKVFGSPRLTLLKNGGGRINDFINESSLRSIRKDAKVGIYMPTYRKLFSRDTDGLIRDNLFNFSVFDESALDDFLIKNNIIIVVKKHPLDERDFKGGNNIIMFDDQKFNNSGFDLYECLADTDFLITDYSSVMFDYAILKKPIYLIGGDSQEYADTRGFLFEPHNQLIGLNVIETQESLINKLSEMNDNLTDDNLGKIIHNGAENLEKIVSWINDLQKGV